MLTGRDNSWIDIPNCFIGSKRGNMRTQSVFIDAQELLFGNELAPITSSMGFIQGRYLDVVEKFIAWQEEISRLDGHIRRIKTHEVNGDLRKAFFSILPFKKIQSNRSLFIPTDSGWTAYVENNYRGTDPSVISYLPKALQSSSIWMVTIPHTWKRSGSVRSGQSGALLFVVYGHEEGKWNNMIRSIRLEHDVGRWRFEELGNPLPFEDKRTVIKPGAKNRFTFEMLKRYMHNYGLRPFEEDFYLPPSAGKAIVMEKFESGLPPIEDVSFSEARRLNWIVD